MDQLINENREWFEERLIERFTRYVKIETTSNPEGLTHPTTAGQLELARVIKKELEEMGVKEAELDENGFLIAFIPARNSVNCIGYLAHFDTSFDVSGKNVNPLIHKNYNGEPVVLKQGIVIDPESSPELKKYKGGTVITADGTTLLGADDKAGLAEIMTIADYLLTNKTISHCGLEIIFTPDEETGTGMNLFPLQKIKSSYCYTFDGEGGEFIEAECFEAYKAEVVIHGKSFHPGKARRKLINSIDIACRFLSMLPAIEKPETTDQQDGFYHPMNISGEIETTRIQILIRDFEESICLNRIEALNRIAKALEILFPGSSIQVNVAKQYSNMKQYFKNQPKGLELLESAVAKTGITPQYISIRGGTDGARLSEMGIPCPNIFNGGHNFHSKQEWAALDAMVNAVLTGIHLANLWA